MKYDCKCSVCGNGFVAYKPGARTCGTACRKRASRMARGEVAKVHRVACEVCLEAFNTHQPTARFCCDECRAKYWAEQRRTAPVTAHATPPVTPDYYAAAAKAALARVEILTREIEEEEATRSRATAPVTPAIEARTVKVQVTKITKEIKVPKYPATPAATAPVTPVATAPVTPEESTPTKPRRITARGVAKVIDKEWAEWEADFEEKLGRSLGGELLRLHVTPYIDTDSDPRCADDLLVIQHKCLDLAVRVYPLLKNDEIAALLADWIEHGGPVWNEEHERWKRGTLEKPRATAAVTPVATAPVTPAKGSLVTVSGRGLPGSTGWVPSLTFAELDDIERAGKAKKRADELAVKFEAAKAQRNTASVTPATEGHSGGP